MEQTINFYTFLDIIDCQLIITRYPNQENRFSAWIEDCEVKELTILSGIYGNGNTPNNAVIDYIKLIKGKLIVINAISPTLRKEYKVPKNITL